MRLFRSDCSRLLRHLRDLVEVCGIARVCQRLASIATVALALQESRCCCAQQRCTSLKLHFAEAALRRSLLALVAAMHLLQIIFTCGVIRLGASYFFAAFIFVLGHIRRNSYI